MQILITGSNGLVGTSLQKIIKLNMKTNLINYIFLTSKECNLTNSEEVDNIFNKYKPEIVIHLASKVAGLYGNLTNNYNMFLDNVKINTNILDNCNKYKVKRLINILSTCIFPDKGITYPLTSKDILNGEPHYSNYGYAHSKRILYIGSKLLSETMDVINIIPTNLYGKEDNYSLTNGHVIPSLIHKIYLAKINKTKLIIKGTGDAKRQFVYAHDIAHIIYQCMFINIENHNLTFILSPSKSKEISIKDLVNLLTGLMNYNGKIEYDTNNVNGQIKKTTDNKELLDIFPNFKFTKLEFGLIDTINYFIINYNRLRK